MERIAVRELRNQASSVVRRARAGERMLITVDGVPVAEIGPVRATERAASLPELIASGAVHGPRSRTAARPPQPVPAPSGGSSSSVLRDLRDR
jgi:prevent-host-death family protein